MYPASQEFHEQMQADKRRVFALCQIDYTDPFTDQSVIVTGAIDARYSYPDQTADGVDAPTAKFASLDGSWVLGENYEPAPGPDEAKRIQMGWWSKQLSGMDNEFTDPMPSLSVEFSARSVDRFRIVGDSKRGEWPVHFIASIYDEDGPLYAVEEKNNNSITWVKEFGQSYENVTRAILVIYKWSHPGRQAKILEFFTSLQRTYETGDIIRINLVEERESGIGSLPIGVISSNEASIRLEKSLFDRQGAGSVLLNMLRPNRKIQLWLGMQNIVTSLPWGSLRELTWGELLETYTWGDLKSTFIKDVYIPLGVFWSSDWSIPDEELYVQTTARDRLELLRHSIYDAGGVEEGKTLHSIAADILGDAGLTKDEYWIDPRLEQIIIPYSYFVPQTHREALRKVAEACVGQIYCDREGIVRVESPSYNIPVIPTTEKAYFIQGACFAAKSKTADVFSISSDDFFTKDNPAKWGEIANYVEVETQPLRPDNEEKEVYRSNEPIELGPGQTVEITAQFNHTPCTNAGARLELITGTAGITKSACYAGSADVTIYSPDASTFDLVIEATPLQVCGSEVIVAQDEDSIAENGIIKFTFSGNPLVQTRKMARYIAETILEFYKDPRRNLEMDWRGNPALELGDIISVPDYQKGGIDERGLFIIVRQEIEYTGALRARLTGRRIQG